jgi:ubiquinone biosynthesis protein
MDMKADLRPDSPTASHTARQAPAPGSTIGRAIQIAWKVTVYVLWVLGWRASLARRPTPAQRFARLLEDLGTSFVKLGQHLSLRSDLFPADYIAELQKLQDNVKPFPVEEAVAAIEQAFGKRPEQLFIRFDAEPIAAASVAQVHGARTFSGREVVVKVLRPGVAIQVDRDMRMLAVIVRFLSYFSPVLSRYRAEAVVREVWANLRRELDLREEARHVKRFAAEFRALETIVVPDVIEDLSSETVMVQSRLHGRRLGPADTEHEGPRLAESLIDAYVHMFLVMGFFHGDPHPGNLFVMPDGRLGLHDFGVVGSLDRPTRHALGSFMLAFTEQDTEWVLDSWLELGMITRGADRDRMRAVVSALMSDYARRPISEWSIGEAFLRLVNASRGYHFSVPLHLLVLGRTLILIEATVRLLHPGFSLLDALCERSRDVMSKALGEERQTRRLQYEAAIASTEWQRLLASSLRRLREDGLKLKVDHEGLPELSEHIVTGSNRVALALVTLGLYLAASLLMQFKSGFQVGDFPALPFIFYCAAVWFTWRLVRAVGRKL